jgi:hypothetical protein
MEAVMIKVDYYTGIREEGLRKTTRNWVMVVDLR